MNKGISKKDERLLLESYAQALWPEACLLDEVPNYGWRLARDGIHHGDFYMNYDPIEDPWYPINIWCIEPINGSKCTQKHNFKWSNESSFTLEWKGAYRDISGYFLRFPSTIQLDSKVINQLQQIKGKPVNSQYAPNKIPKKYKKVRKGIALINAFLSMKSFKKTHSWGEEKVEAPQVFRVWKNLDASDQYGYFRFGLDTNPNSWRPCCYDCEYRSDENSIVLGLQYVKPIYFYPITKNCIYYDIINSEYLIFKEVQTGTIFQGTPEEIKHYHKELIKIK